MTLAENKIILITGGSGFLGYSLCRFLKNRYTIHATFFSHPCSINGCRLIHLDITSPSQVLQTVSAIQPALIIHAAAVSSPDACEKDRDNAWRINVDGSRNLACASRIAGCRLIYISTDMVFDGEKGYYSENDVPKPSNFYGESKLEGERICLTESPDCVVIRITLQYGWGNGTAASFSDWLLGNLRSGKPSKLFCDQFRSPTYVIDTAKGLEHAALYADSGTMYHLASPERIDRYSFGLAAASVFNFSDTLLVKSLMKDVPASAPRPRDVSLNGDGFANRFNFRPRNVYEGLTAMSSEQTQAE